MKGLKLETIALNKRQTLVRQLKTNLRAHKINKLRGLCEKWGEEVSSAVHIAYFHHNSELKLRDEVL